MVLSPDTPARTLREAVSAFRNALQEFGVETKPVVVLHGADIDKIREPLAGCLGPGYALTYDGVTFTTLVTQELRDRVSPPGPECFDVLVDADGEEHLIHMPHPERESDLYRDVREYLMAVQRFYGPHELSSLMRPGA